MRNVSELLPGQYKNDMRNGKGTCSYSDGSKYVGDWVDDQKVGQGVFTLPDGERYEMRHSKYHFIICSHKKHRIKYMNDDL
jgi:hypothetical protein